jgi:hypothetical protein
MRHVPSSDVDRRRCSQPCRGLKVIAVTEEVWPLNTEIGTPSGNLHCTTGQPPYIKCFQTQYATLNCLFSNCLYPKQISEVKTLNTKLGKENFAFDVTSFFTEHT